MEILKVILVSIVLIAIAVVGLTVNILVKKKGKFPNTHVSGNEYLKRNGVYCSQIQDRLEQDQIKKKVNFNDVRITGI
ncbi:MAG: hypothetical protein LBV47_00345 [Bacteroidales bacterium]|jgi:hypothetical protein|nr:hypothetical protein [Bacteroidales bacterium]